MLTRAGPVMQAMRRAPGGEEVLGGLAGAELVVDDDGVDVVLVALGAPVDGHHGDAPLEEHVEAGVPGRRHGDHHAGHLLGHRDVEVGGLLLEVLVGVPQHQPVALGQGHVLHPPDHRGEEGVLDVGDDRRPHPGALLAEGARRSRRGVAELGGRLPHPWRPARRTPPRSR